MDKIRRRTGSDYNFDDPDANDTVRAKKVRFPKGKKESARRIDTEPIFGEEDGGPILSTDPRVAAKERTMKRTVGDQQILKSDDISLIPDVGAAEEEGDGNFTEDGIVIEPFNLKQEREEGYFDGEGNYVEYRLNDDDKDAWFETAKVDESLQLKKLKAMEKIEDQGEDTELTKEEIWVIQKRIAAALLPEETILQAFRRLKGVKKDKKWSEPMSADTKLIFDRLTEDAMKLMDNGDYNIYHEPKETLQREAEGYEALARARRGETSGSHGLGNNVGGRVQPTPQVQPAVGASDSFDIFGDDDEDLPATSRLGETVKEDNAGAQNGGLAELPGYVYDESSGYYYSATDGYYFDKNTGLFCNAESGQWFMYDGANASYLEAPETGETGVQTSSNGTMA